MTNELESVQLFPTNKSVLVLCDLFKFREKKMAALVFPGSFRREEQLQIRENVLLAALSDINKDLTNFREEVERTRFSNLERDQAVVRNFVSLSLFKQARRSLRVAKQQSSVGRWSPKCSR